MDSTSPAGLAVAEAIDERDRAVPPRSEGRSMLVAAEIAMALMLAWFGAQIIPSLPL